MISKYAFLAKLEETKLSKAMPPILPLSGAHVLFHEKRMLNFSSHDFLGLSESQELKKNSMRYLLEYGLTPASSYYPRASLHSEQKLEDLCAQRTGKETCRFFHSRSCANVLTLSTLASSDSLLFLDRSCHVSLKEGAMRSYGRMKYYKHNDMSHLESLLEASKDTPCSSKWIVTESLFGQEGDVFFLNELQTLAKEYDALLYVDDSHSLGIMGFEGMGLSAHQKEIDVISGTFDKSCGGFGGYISLSHKMKEYLLRFCPQAATHSLPPAVLGTIESALELIPQLEGERKQLSQRAHWIRKQLQKEGFPMDNSFSPLFSLSFCTEKEALQQLELLGIAEILAYLLPPSQEEDVYRVGFAVTSHHSPEHLTYLAQTLKSQIVPVN